MRDRGVSNVARWQHEQEQELYVLSFLCSRRYVSDRRGRSLTPKRPGNGEAGEQQQPSPHAPTL
jgi:hypothetical protein